MLRRDDVRLLLFEKALDVGADAEEEVAVFLGSGLSEVGRLGEEGVEGGEETDGMERAFVEGGRGDESWKLSAQPDDCLRHRHERRRNQSLVPNHSAHSHSTISSTDREEKQCFSRLRYAAHASAHAPSVLGPPPLWGVHAVGEALGLWAG